MMTYRTDPTINIQTLLFTVAFTNDPTPTVSASHIDVARVEVCQ
jgi:hypothetical protein